MEVKRLGHEANQSPPFRAEVKNAWRYTFTPPYVFLEWCLVKHSDRFKYFCFLSFFSASFILVLCFSFSFYYISFSFFYYNSLYPLFILLLSLILLILFILFPPLFITVLHSSHIHSSPLFIFLFSLFLLTFQHLLPDLIFVYCLFMNCKLISMSYFKTTHTYIFPHSVYNFRCNISIYKPISPPFPLINLKSLCLSVLFFSERYSHQVSAD